MLKNGGLLPEIFTKGSGTKVWWVCENKHSYSATIAHRIDGRGCPFCYKASRINPNGNDLATVNPRIAKEWNYEKNGNLTPKNVSKCSNKTVWWKCENGHEWENSITYRTSHDSICPYCSGKRILIGLNDLATIRPDLVKEWNYEKNGELTPQMVSRGSQQKVWWKCEKGHEWQANIANRTILNRGCPFCSKQKIVKGYNDLATTHPDILQNWNYEKNSELTPQMVSRGSRKKVWWKCDKGHEWQSTIYHKTNGTPCPICARINYAKKLSLAKPGFSLADLNPQLAREWNIDKNYPLTASMVMLGSTKKVWWKCARGHEWKSSIHSRNNGIGCPFCNGKQAIQGETDLATTAPELAKEWNYEKNGDLIPQMFTKGSGKKVWWKCANGHEWQAIINSRRKGCGCPCCSNSRVIVGVNDLATIRPDLVKEWNYDKNQNLTPQMVSRGSRKKVWWKCQKGHEWQTRVDCRTNRNSGCPYCNHRKLLQGYNDLATTTELAK